MKLLCLDEQRRQGLSSRAIELAYPCVVWLDIPILDTHQNELEKGQMRDTFEFIR